MVSYAVYFHWVIFEGKKSNVPMKHQIHLFCLRIDLLMHLLVKPQKSARLCKCQTFKIKML